jgi:ectoine hydroxylase-related dioxygenase (phytanoyl-CoA dioxygenase family)
MNDTELTSFANAGFLVLPGFLSESQRAALKAEADQYVEAWRDENNHKMRPCAMDYEACTRLATEPRLMTCLDAIMGKQFALHHLHVARHKVGDPGVTWHHDYEQVPQTNRKHIMVHVFFYLSKLNGTIGDLLLIPGSHKTVVDRGAIGDVFGFESLPGMVVINEAPAGTAVIVHSAIWHARRPKPGGNDLPRCFIDISYCQAGVTWPNERVWITKPPQAVERGWVTPGREGVMDRAMFADGATMLSYVAGRSGSLSLQLQSERTP